MSEELDRMERDAIQAIERLRAEYERAAAPYIKILNDIYNVRPHVTVIDGKTFVPILPQRTSFNDSAGGSHDDVAGSSVGRAP